jgi:hypothetical protein
MANVFFLLLLVVGGGFGAAMHHLRKGNVASSDAG